MSSVDVPGGALSESWPRRNGFVGSVVEVTTSDGASAIGMTVKQHKHDKQLRNPAHR
jgi:hypothetical protein